MQQKSNDGLAGGSFFVSLVTISSSTYVSLKSSEVFTPSIYSRVRASRTDSLVAAATRGHASRSMLHCACGGGEPARFAAKAGRLQELHLSPNPPLFGATS